MNFHRYYIPGAAVFITQVVQDRKPVFCNAQYMALLRETWLNVQTLHPFLVLGYVFLYEHFHVLLQPIGDSNFSDILHSLKPAFTREYKKLLGLPTSQSVKFWQKRFWDHVIRNERDFENHLHYIHFNPVKHGLVKDPREWLHSSYFEWEQRGLYPPAFDWQEPMNIEWGE
jgi:putative transposase